MTRYLKQTAVVRRCQQDALGNPILDDYGQPIIGKDEILKCRREPVMQRGATGQGQFVNYSSVYYFDESAHIRRGDIIDGHEVQEISDYILGTGQLVGQEVRV